LNGVRLEAASLFGCGEDVGRFVELSELSLATFGLIVRFGFGFADCSGADAGLSSVIGAGDRCAVMNSKQ
jgi:hypothetical protein